jgi:hypothetical protein
VPTPTRSPTKSESAATRGRLRPGPFTSQEHVVPEGLGNKHLVLPMGVVCDPCNNGPLSALDGESLNFPPVAMMRTIRGVPTKQGRLPPAARFANASVRRVGPEIVFEANTHEAHVEVGYRQDDRRSGQPWLS